MKQLTFLICLVFFTSLGWAQEPTKPKFEKIIYQDGDKIIVQKELPIYLSISTEPNGKAFNLKSTQNPADANPMYFDTEGENFIRSKWAVDPETKKYTIPQREILLPVYADGIAPSTRLTFNDAPRYRQGGVTYYGKNLSYTINATDAVSGVKDIYHALNGSYEKYVSKAKTINKEGVNSLYYFSSDNVGNAEETKVETFTLDLTAPNTKLATVTGASVVDSETYKTTPVLGLKTQLALASTDAISGVNKIEYSLDDNGTRRYTKNINYNSLPDGEHTVNYYATDNVENRETTKTFKFYLDKTAPETSIDVMGDQFQGNNLYVSDRTKFKLTATDNKSGVARTNFSTQNNANAQYSSPFNLEGESRQRSIVYYSEDNVDNIESKNTKNVYLDTDKPATRLEYGKPLFFSRDTIFITSKTPVTLIANDKSSGVKSTSYTVNSMQESVYQAPFYVKDEGNTIIKFNSVDQVNNKETEKTSRNFVDNTAPEIYINFSLDAIGTQDGLPIYPNYVRMFIGATDDHTGTEKILYSINDDEKIEYSSPRTIDISERGTFIESKTYSVVVEASDKLGNLSSKTFEFIVVGE